MTGADETLDVTVDEEDMDVDSEVVNFKKPLDVSQCKVSDPPPLVSSATCRTLVRPVDGWIYLNADPRPRA